MHSGTCNPTNYDGCECEGLNEGDYCEIEIGGGKSDANRIHLNKKWSAIPFAVLMILIFA